MAHIQALVGPKEAAPVPDPDNAETQHDAGIVVRLDVEPSRGRGDGGPGPARQSVAREARRGG